MKLAKLSLATVMALSATSAFAATDLESAFKEGTYKGQAVIYYQTADSAAGGATNMATVNAVRGTATAADFIAKAGIKTDKGDLFGEESSRGNAGLELGFSTAPLYGVSANVVFNHLDTLGLEKWMVDNVMMSPVTVSDYAVRGDGTVDVKNADGGSWLSVANLKYNHEMFDVAVGRMAIPTPLVNSDTWNVFPNTFEAVLAHVKLPGLVLAGAYVTSENTMNQGITGAKKFSKFMGSDYAYALAAIAPNIMNSGVTARGFYYGAKDVTNAPVVGAVPAADASAYYVDVAGKVSIVDVAAQYMSFTTDLPVADDTTDAFGVKVGAEFGQFGVNAAYSDVSKGTLYATNLGDNGTKTPLYTATVSGDGDIAGMPDTSSFRVEATAKDLGLAGLKLSLAYGSYEHSKTTDTSTELVATYAASKNLNLYTGIYMTEHESKTGYFAYLDGDSHATVRVIARYSFGNK